MSAPCCLHKWAVPRLIVPLLAVQAGRTAAAGSASQDDAIQNASNAVIDLLARGDVFAGAPPGLLACYACMCTGRAHEGNQACRCMKRVRLQRHRLSEAPSPAEGMCVLAFMCMRMHTRICGDARKYVCMSANQQHSLVQASTSS